MKNSVYMQIVSDIKRKIALGVFAEGEKLPSCRELGLRLGINPNTVQRAYATLEEDGVIYTIPKKGIYVGNPSGDRDAVAEEKLRELKAAGYSLEECIKMLKKIYEVHND